MISAASMSQTCRRCGMPLAYDAVVAPATSDTRAELCSFCLARTTGVKAPPQPTEAAWVLDLILDVYLGRRPGARRVARGVARLGSRVPLAARAVAEVVRSVPERRPDATYDAVVLYSGGKDSTYMLLDLAQRPGIRVCAWMLQQGYQSPAAIRNAERICERLGVPLVISTPERSAMDSLFRIGFGLREDSVADQELLKAVMTYGSACWPCFATIAARAATFCDEVGAAFCFIGTQRGQNRLDLHGQPVLAGQGLPRVDFMTEKFMRRFRALAEESDDEAAALLQTTECQTVLVPFYELVPKPSVDEQIAFIQRAGWTLPMNTGACSTNCMINELGRQVMRTRYGFDLYQIIDAHEQRLADRGPAAIAPLDEDAVERGARLIGLSDDEREEYGLETPGARVTR
jgi:hypothetical protein